MLCAIYCRLSKEDEDKHMESESIQNQKSLLIKYAVEKGWDIYKIYCDEDFSGADSQRPDFNLMLTAAEGRKFNVVLCKTQSRFTRDMELVEKYIHGKFPLWGIRFVAIADNVDTDVKGNKKARQINGLINEWYLEDLSENIRMVLDSKRRDGQYIGGFPLYGYRADPADKHHLVIDQEAAAVVRQIFQWSLEGEGKQRIAARLNAQGVPSPTKYKLDHGLPYRNGSGGTRYDLWNKNTVWRMLRNEMYLGNMVQGRAKKVSYKSKQVLTQPRENWITVENTHEAIIERDIFSRVQEGMNRRTRTDGTGETHLLAGHVRCMDCGSTMSRSSNTYKGARRSYLRCKLSVTDPTRCTRHAIRLDALIELVEGKIRDYVGRYYELGDVGRLVDKEKPDTRCVAAEKERLSLESQIEKRTAALRQLYLDKVSGLIDEAQFAGFNRDFLAEKSRLERRSEELTALLEGWHGAEESKDDTLARAQKLLALDTVDRELVALLIDWIEVGEKDKETGQQKLHIQWKF
ncbi:MAG: recombinase family protein [Oscillospiraceae bacterium]